MDKDAKVIKTIITRLFSDRTIGGKHTAFENLVKGFPKHLRGEAKEIAEKLMRKGLITPKPTSYGMQVSLNPYRMTEIEEIIKDP
jgi:hypothetical protein